MIAAVHDKLEGRDIAVGPAFVHGDRANRVTGFQTVIPVVDAGDEKHLERIVDGTLRGGSAAVEGVVNRRLRIIIEQRDGFGRRIAARKRENRGRIQLRAGALRFRGTKLRVR